MNDNIVHDLLTNPNYGDTETAVMYANFTVEKVKRLRRIAEEIDAILAAEEPTEDGSLGDVDPIEELKDEFKQIEESLTPIKFRLRPVGPIALAQVQEQHDAAIVRAQGEIERFEANPETELNQAIVLDGLPIMLEARLAAAAIVHPVIAPREWLAMIEKFGGAAMAELIAVKESCINRDVAVAIPKLPATLGRSQT